MNILAIETSCDDAGVAIFNGRKEVVTLTKRQTVHSKTGGVVPEVASREHLRTLTPLIEQALQTSRLNLEDIDYFAVTAGPGLMGALLVGAQTARTLSCVTGKPLYGLNHLEGHIYANWIGANPPLPALVCLVSGGHSQLILMNAHGKYQLLGETLDDAAGEAFDKVAKLLGLGYPGGPEISKRGEHGDDSRFVFPIAMKRSGDLNFSFSGLKTAALYELQKLTAGHPGSITSSSSRKRGSDSRSTSRMTLNQINDFSASFEKAVVRSITIKIEQALDKYKVKSLILSGGVAANKRLRKESEELAKQKKVKFFVPEPALCTDNAAMMASAAYFHIKNGLKPKKFTVSSSMRLR